MRRALVIACIGVLIGPIIVRSAQAQSQGTPSNEELDALAAARNWNALGEALSQPKDNASFSRTMDWLQTRINAGGGSLLGFIYARDLWRAGNSLRVDDPATDMRLTAGLMALYTYELIVIDGAKCADATAPGHRIDQLFSAQAPALAFLKAQPAALKAKVVEIAIGLEKRTAPLRKLDDLLCRDGMDQMRAGLERGKQHDVPTPAGQVGKTVEVEAPPDWVPKFVPAATYKPKQDKARAGMKATLSKLIQ